jgi:hypothetical protein
MRGDMSTSCVAEFRYYSIAVRTIFFETCRNFLIEMDVVRLLAQMANRVLPPIAHWLGWQDFGHAAAIVQRTRRTPVIKKNW